MTHPRRVAGVEREPRGTPGDGAPEAVRVRMLGGFSISVGLRTIEDKEWRLKKAASLIKLLALAEGHRLHREQVMGLLWPDLDAKAAANNLHYALYHARRTLEPDRRAKASRYLVFRGELLELCPEVPLRVDVGTFEEAAAIARSTREPATYRATLDLYAGDLLPQDRYEAWVEDRREGLRGLYLRLLLELARIYEEREDLESAIEALGEAVAKESAHEEAHAGLMRLYALCGRHQEALGQYQRLREVLSREPAREPTAASQSLQEQILAGRFPPSQPAQEEKEERPPEGAPGGRHNLPAARTSFVGRERELAEVKRMLAVTWLLTLTGTGGSGKTRLALEVAKELTGAYPDGAWLVDLVGLAEPGLLPQEVARALSVREQPNRPLISTLADHLRTKSLLLILDNCEHLIEAAAYLAETLLRACPRLRILATSRQALGVPGEANLQVPSLTVPDAGDPPAAQNLTRYESVRLFVDRARLRVATFDLTPQNARAVAEICRKLEGIPLAIELAAARVGALSVEQIARRLEDPLKLLTVGGGWMADPRHRTLRKTLDWSHGLLDEPERKLFRRLSVFAGGWTLEAAETVGAGDGVAGKDVLDLLSQLIDKSLVVAEAIGDGALRYRFLEPVRQYGLERLEESGEADAVRRWHAAFFLALAEEAEPELKGPQQGEWLEQLEREHDNLRASLSWLLERGEGEVGLQLAAAVRSFWDTHGHLSEGRRWLERGISVSTPEATPTRAMALNGAGWIAMWQGDYGAAKALLDESLALYRELGDKEGIASALTNLGNVAVLGQRDLASIPSLLEEAMGLRAELRDRHTLAHLLIFAGLVVGSQGDLKQAIALHEESLALFREIRDTRGICGCLYTLGLIEMTQGNDVRATTLLREVLHLSWESDDKLSIQYAFVGLAGVAASRVQSVRAARLWGAADAMRETSGMQLPPLVRSFTNYEGRLATTRAELGDAAFEAAWAEGRAMDLGEAVEYALSGEGERPKKSATSSVPEGPSAGGRPAALTRREEEVASLVGWGLTNRRIAEELSISERTVDAHLRKILKKLGFRSRFQVAVWVAEQQDPLP